MTQTHARDAARAVVLLSGGIDSVTLLHVLKDERSDRELHALSFQYGQRHARELEMARWQADRVGVTAHRVIDLSFYGALVEGGSALTDRTLELPDLAALTDEQRRQPPTYVPHRNLLLLALAAGYAEAIGATEVFYGAQMQDQYGYWDCTTDFVARLNDLLGLNRKRPVRVQAPFVQRRKADIVRIGRRLNVDYTQTWSCYRGGARPCGTCPSCMERDAAFREVDGH